MKTTSYEISKKLKEAGFEAKTDFYWYCYDKGQEMRHIADADGRGNVKAYDLETLLDALPTETSKIKHGFYKNDLFIQFEPIKIGYYEPCYEYSGHYDMREGIFESCQKENESLADTAGRLLIKLFEAGIVNFKK